MKFTNVNFLSDEQRKFFLFCFSRNDEIQKEIEEGIRDYEDDNYLSFPESKYLSHLIENCKNKYSEFLLLKEQILNKFKRNFDQNKEFSKIIDNNYISRIVEDNFDRYKRKNLFSDFTSTYIFYPNSLEKVLTDKLNFDEENTNDENLKQIFHNFFNELKNYLQKIIDTNPEENIQTLMNNNKDFLFEIGKKYDSLFKKYILNNVNYDYIKEHIDDNDFVKFLSCNVYLGSVDQLYEYQLYQINSIDLHASDQNSEGAFYYFSYEYYDEYYDEYYQLSNIPDTVDGEHSLLIPYINEIIKDIENIVLKSMEIFNSNPEEFFEFVDKTGIVEKLKESHNKYLLNKMEIIETTPLDIFNSIYSYEKQKNDFYNNSELFNIAKNITKNNHPKNSHQCVSKTSSTNLIISYMEKINILWDSLDDNSSEYPMMKLYDKNHSSLINFNLYWDRFNLYWDRDNEKSYLNEIYKYYSQKDKEKTLLLISTIENYSNSSTQNLNNDIQNLINIKQSSEIENIDPNIISNYLFNYLDINKKINRIPNKVEDLLYDYLLKIAKTSSSELELSEKYDKINTTLLELSKQFPENNHIYSPLRKKVLNEIFKSYNDFSIKYYLSENEKEKYNKLDPTTKKRLSNIGKNYLESLSPHHLTHVQWSKFLSNHLDKMQDFKQLLGDPDIVAQPLNKISNILTYRDKVIEIFGTEGINKYKTLKELVDKLGFYNVYTKEEIEKHNINNKSLEIAFNIYKINNEYLPTPKKLSKFMEKVNKSSEKLQPDPNNPYFQEIPPVSIQIENTIFTITQKNDIINYVLGNMTSCCQTINGFAESCVIDGLTNPYSGFLKITDTKNNLIAQAYIWESKLNNGEKVLVLDNIETKGTLHNQTKFINQLVQWAQQFKTQYGYGYISLGKGYSKINLSQFESFDMQDVFNNRNNNVKYNNDAKKAIKLARKQYINILCSISKIKFINLFSLSNFDKYLLLKKSGFLLYL